MAKEIPFKVTVKTTVAIEMTVDINASQNFADARTLGVTAVDNWLRDMLINENEKPWPNPQCKMGKIELVRVVGTWERDE